MESDVLEVRMLGGFFLRWGETVLEMGGRSRKLYLLLACIIRERDRGVPYEELAALLWPGVEPDDTTWRALKAIIHRARQFLEGLGEDAGKFLIHRSGMCRWNPEVTVRLDAEEFSALCREGSGDKVLLLERRLRALKLYQGDFLPAAGNCSWALEQTRALHRLWHRVILDVLPILAEEGRWEQAAALTADALVLEPKEEALCRSRMEALLALGRKREAAQTYERFQRVLMDRKGALPSNALQTLYSAALDNPNSQIILPADLPQLLQEPSAPGALLCGFDFFRVLCFSLVRSAQRAKQPLHAALFTLSGEKEALPRYSLDRAMNNLQGIILENLRRGDAATRCSTSQFAILLPQAGYEDAKQVSQRVARAFTRQFPHAPVKLDFAVLPLTAP